MSSAFWGQIRKRLASSSRSSWLLSLVHPAQLPPSIATIASMPERSSAGWPASDSLVAKGIALREGAEHESNRRIVGTDVRAPGPRERTLL